MRRHPAPAICIAIAITWLSFAHSAYAAEDARDRISKMLADADIAAAEALATAELEHLPANTTQAAWWYNQNGLIAEARGQYALALSWFDRALRIRRRHLGLQHAETTASLNNVALMEGQTGRHRAALLHVQQAWRANVAMLGERHRQSVTTLSNMGLLNLTMGHISQSRAQLQKALEATTLSEGWWSDNTATGLSNLASVYVTEFRFDDAEKRLLRALAIDEYRHGSQHPKVAIALNNLGELYRLQARPVEAEQAYLRAAAMDRKLLGEDSSGYAIDMLNLAALYGQAGRIEDARTSLDIALPIITRQLSGHPEVTTAALSELSHLLCSQNRCAQARHLLQQAADRMSKTFGTNSFTSLQLHDDLAMVHTSLGDQAAAVRDRKAYLASVTAAFGPQGPFVLRARIRLAEALAADGRLDDAGRQVSGLQPLVDSIFGKRSIDAAHLWELKARLAFADRNRSKALHQARRSLALFRIWLSPNASKLAQLHDFLSRIHSEQGHWRQAVTEAQRALRIVSDRSRLAATHLRDSPPDEGGITRNALATAITAARHFRSNAAPINTAFRAAELIADNSRNHAVTWGTLKRRALKTGSLPLLHRQSLLLASMESLDNASIGAFSTGAVVPTIQSRRQSIHRELDLLADQLAHALPQYAELLEHRLLAPTEIQRQLRDGEVLLYLLPMHETLAVLAMSNDARVAHITDMPVADLTDKVARLRTGLDPLQWKNSFEPFDRTLAFRLYAQLLKPIEPMLRSSRTLFVVSGAPLDGLPLAVLVDRPPAGGTAGDSAPDTLRTTSWLGRRFGIVQIPSASALWHLRSPEAVASVPDSFLGVGTQTVSFGRDASPLPDLQAAEPELRLLARAFDKPGSTLLLGASATKASFHQANPRRKSVIAFATHTLSAEQSGFGEPALALTAAGRPARADGVLTASEIAGLDLAAEWVILSGCNTAGDGASSALTLADAFAKAGARSLLVSHWPVSDRYAARLTTAVVGNFRARPRAGQADALRRAMIDTMEDRSHPLNAHPSTWAAFSLLGEARRADRPD
jgi:CHAT domain-containing protein/Tfp pilus assembly protein PilF